MATIIFDLDDTLYNTKKFKEDIHAILSAHGISTEDIWNSYDKIRDTGNYTFEEHLEELSKIYKDLKTEEVVAKLFKLLEKSYLFPGSENTLQELKKKHVLLLLTLGGEKTQQRKIAISGIEKYFDAIHITQKDKTELLKDLNIGGEVYFVNDKINENEKVKELFPHFNIIEIKNGESVVIPNSP